MDSLDEFLLWVEFLQRDDFHVSAGKATIALYYVEPKDIVGFYRARDGKDIYANVSH